MADLFVGFNRGVEGFKPSDFTTGSSTGSTDIELRLDDTKGFTRLDVLKALEAFRRYFESQIIQGANPPGL